MGDQLAISESIPKAWRACAIGLAFIGAACAPSAKTVANVTTGITGCPADSLVVFNYAKATRTWFASCGEKLYVCSDGRGDVRCTAQQADTIDHELQLRAKALLSLSAKQRESFVDDDFSAEDWPTFARRVAVVKTLTDQQLMKVDPKLVFGESTASFDRALQTCSAGKNVPLLVKADGTLAFSETTAPGKPQPCSAILTRPELATLRKPPERTVLLVPGVFDIKPIDRPTLAPTAPSAQPGATGVATGAAEAPPPAAAAAPSAPAPSAALDTAVRHWLDLKSSAIAACTGKAQNVLIVDVAADGKPQVSIRGVATSAPEVGCVRSVLATPPALPPGPGQVLHVVGTTP